MRPKQFWLPDLRDPEVRSRIEREVAALNASEDEAAVMQSIEAMNAALMESLPPYDWGDEPPAMEEPAAK